MPNKIKLGISACLLGEHVRYNGGHKHDREMLKAFGQDMEFVPICPETGCGMTIPREPLGLYGNPDCPSIVALKTKIDHSECMHLWGIKKLGEIGRENLCGYIFKSKSPSCGMSKIEIQGFDGILRNNGIGFWAGMFAEYFPMIPAADESTLQDPSAREDFISKIISFARMREKD